MSRIGFLLHTPASAPRHLRSSLATNRQRLGGGSNRTPECGSFRPFTPSTILLKRNKLVPPPATPPSIEAPQGGIASRRFLFCSFSQRGCAIGHLREPLPLPFSLVSRCQARQAAQTGSASTVAFRVAITIGGTEARCPRTLEHHSYFDSHVVS